MGDYGKLSNFNPKANFNMVRFGADTPITEYELNEAQQILDYKQKQLAKSVGDRFTKVGTMSISETLDEEGTKTLILEDNDLLVDGEPIHISTLGTPIQEGETAYLKIFEKEVSKDSEIKEYGNEQHSETLENELLDPRLEGIETARRLQTCYNIETQTTLTKERFTTENGVKEFSCKNGYIDNVVIEGETLVNIAPMVTVNGADPDGVVRTRFSNLGDNYKFYPRTQKGTFTLMNHTDKGIWFVGMTSSDSWAHESFYVEPFSARVVTLDGSRCINGVDFHPEHGWNNSDLSIYKSSMYSILEGDHTDKPISYFEGLKSVGQGDSIEIATYQKDKESELDFTFERANANLNDGTFEPNNTTTNAGTSFIYVGGGKVRLSRNGHIFLYDKNFNFIRSIENAGTSAFDVNEASYIRIWYAEYNMEIKIYHTPYLDKKQISTTLRSLPNGIKDNAEKRDNKYVKVQRCGEVVLNGSEDWFKIEEVVQENTIQFGLKKGNDVAYKGDSEIFFNCDKIPPTEEENWQEDREFIFINPEDYVLSISKTRLSTQDVEGLKALLKENPLTIVYELENPIEEELPNFNPQVFEGDNTLLLNTGVLQGECDFDLYTYQEPIFEEGYKYIPLIQLHQGVEKDLRISDPNKVNFKSLNKDDSNGQFARVEMYRQNNTLKEVSELSDKVNDYFTTQTITYYDELGINVLYTEIYALEYDEDGDLISQELIKRC